MQENRLVSNCTHRIAKYFLETNFVLQDLLCVKNQILQLFAPGQNIAPGECPENDEVEECHHYPPKESTCSKLKRKVQQRTSYETTYLLQPMKENVSCWNDPKEVAIAAQEGEIDQNSLIHIEYPQERDQDQCTDLGIYVIKISSTHLCAIGNPLCRGEEGVRSDNPPTKTFFGKSQLRWQDSFTVDCIAIGFSVGTSLSPSPSPVPS